MAKRKFELSSDLIQISENDHYAEVSTVVVEEKKRGAPKKEERENLTIRMAPSLAMELKIWCATNKISMSDALAKGFELLKELKDKDL